MLQISATKSISHSMAEASNATTGFLSAKASANLDDIIRVLDAALKGIGVAGAAGGIAVGVWKYAEISAAFSRILKNKAQSGDEEIAVEAVRTGGLPVEEAVHTAVRALRAVNEVGASDRMEEVLRRAETQ